MVDGSWEARGGAAGNQADRTTNCFILITLISLFQSSVIVLCSPSILSFCANHFSFLSDDDDEWRCR
jgi:hypothetical protein